MTSILSQYTSSGFYNAPTSKGILCYMLIKYTALNMPSMMHLRKYFVCKVSDLFLKFNIWQLIGSRISILDFKDYLLCSFLIYYLRIFERRLGSYKYINFIITTQVFSLLLEFLFICGLNFFESDFHDGYLASGIYSLIFSLMLLYFFDIPKVNQSHIYGIPITGKTFAYLMCFQLCSTSNILVAALSGIISSFIYRYNVLYTQRICWIPVCLSSLCKKTVGRLLASDPPQESHIGATLELQRQEQMDLWEEQIFRNRNMEIENQRQGMMSNFIRDFVRGRNDAGPLPPPSENQIKTLTDMGFERQRAIHALQSNRNDINAATNFIIHQTT